MLTRRQFTKLAARSPLAFIPALQTARADIGKLGGGAHDLTILYTNDFHSAFNPIPAYWLPGSPKLGGAAHLATLVERERAAAKTSFLLDSGDMFTGAMSHLTHGEALMEFMTLMRYDAMSAGNHEFDYGWQIFAHAATRVPFPILCCNVRYKTGGFRFLRPHTILERDGVRLGVIGVMGLNAARFTIMPSKVAELEFTDPVAETAACVQELRNTVDVLVVLAHMGLPGAMQTDAENDPDVQRPLDEDLAFCGAVPGIDVYIAAHSHHGLEQPIVHPATGTIITQTYGYGTRLGRIRLSVRNRKVVHHEAALLKTWSDQLPPHPAVAERTAHYRRVVVEQVGAPVGRATERIIRCYNRESPLGSLIADIMRVRAGSDVALTNAGGLRSDLPEGELDRSHVLDVFPFLNNVVTLELAGHDLKAVLEHSLSLKAGMGQVSGVRAVYDLRRPIGSRLVEVHVGGQPVNDEKLYRVTTNSFLAEGGDGYLAFKQGREVARDGQLNDLFYDHIKAAKVISPPTLGRMVPAV
ncbi:MAG: bifunctional metallophosphatase/5'-nucleotidase [Verrucomicrobia bacterium]|nr:bifunctional metallophosphatase/5'-nucleotidase [Verrucomicrobiota bacterium]